MTVRDYNDLRTKIGPVLHAPEVRGLPGCRAVAWVGPDEFYFGRSSRENHRHAEEDILIQHYEKTGDPACRIIAMYIDIKPCGGRYRGHECLEFFTDGGRSLSIGNGTQVCRFVPATNPSTKVYYCLAEPPGGTSAGLTDVKMLNYEEWIRMVVSGSGYTLEDLPG